ncbi:MAG: hypothetical protein EXQ99_05090 [Alphaproteobacteria bacterium]|nr:hypothetical protein [Alphaproteobacteria bacterium]
MTPRLSLRPALLAALIVGGLVLPAAVSAGESAAWRAYMAKDYGRAEQLWRRDAAKGDRHAIFGLGMLADHHADAAQAAIHYEKAARAGLAAAQVLIAECYISGKGVAADPITAFAWLSRAIAAGVPNAAAIRDQLALTMTADAVRQAETLADTLSAK